MPKRLQTPTTADDSQFFTVVNPYPDQPNVSLQDSKIFARWIACVVGEDNFFAFYHKPKSPSVAIIEVPKNNVDTRRLLGAHRWCEILKHPSKDQAGEVSCIYPCTMTTSWSIEKIRWLRRDVESSWFRDWSPKADSTIVYPYPMSHYCQPPFQDVTRSSICRPLQEHLFDKHTKTSTHSILAPAPRSTSPPEDISHRSTPTPSESSNFSSDELLTPPDLPPSDFSLPFIPALHGIDTPKNGGVVIKTAAVESPAVSLWSQYGEQSDNTLPDMCAAHGDLCHSGICKMCGERQRVELREARCRRHQEQKQTSRRRCGRGPSKEGPLGTRISSPTCRSSSTGSAHSKLSSREREKVDRLSRLRDAIPAVTTKGKPVCTRNTSTSSARAKRASPPALTSTRALPLHLRQGATTSACGLPVSSRSPLSSSSSPSSLTPLSSDLDAQSESESAASDSSSSPDDSVSLTSEPHSHSDSSTQPWPDAAKGQLYAKVRDDESVVTGATNETFRNPWKRVPPMQAAPRQWADLCADDAQAHDGARVVRTGSDDDDNFESVSDCGYDQESF